MDHIRVLGCSAYTHIQKERRQQGAKFEPRAEKGLLVGFEGNHIYRLWIPTRNSIVRSSTVKFDESIQDHGLSSDEDDKWQFDLESEIGRAHV